jgi:hypothetical protein
VCLDSDVLIFLGSEYLFNRWLCSFFVWRLSFIGEVGGYFC